MLEDVHKYVPGHCLLHKAVDEVLTLLPVFFLLPGCRYSDGYMMPMDTLRLWLLIFTGKSNLSFITAYILDTVTMLPTKSSRRKSLWKT